MAQRTTFLSGTNFADGEILYAADLNDTYNNMIICKTGSLTGNMFAVSGVAVNISGLSVIPPKDGLYYIQALLQCIYSGTSPNETTTASFIAYTGSPGTAIGSVTLNNRLVMNGHRFIMNYQDTINITSGTEIFMRVRWNNNGTALWASGAEGHKAGLSAFRINI